MLRCCVAALVVAYGLLSGGRALAHEQEARLVLRQATTCSMQYYVSLPPGYERRPDRKWPILFVLIGMRGDCQSAARGFVRARGRLPAIVVVPFTTSNNIDPVLDKYRPLQHWRHPLPPEWWADDEAGILAIHRELQQEFNADDRFYLTAFSSGGLVGFHMLFTHPDHLAGAVLVCPNFFDNNYAERRPQVSTQALDVPVYVMLGEKDPYRYYPSYSRREQMTFLAAAWFLSIATGTFVGWRFSRRFGAGLALAGVAVGGVIALTCVRNIGIDPQVDEALVLLNRFGYTNYRCEEVPGLAHNPAESLVMAKLKPHWKEK
jgi:pimeloyl-ACP methyl ester carboxylesterase